MYRFGIYTLGGSNARYQIGKSGWPRQIGVG
jgi:hypothetical protein